MTEAANTFREGHGRKAWCEPRDEDGGFRCWADDLDHAWEGVTDAVTGDVTLFHAVGERVDDGYGLDAMPEPRCTSSFRVRWVERSEDEGLMLGAPL